VCSLLTFIFLTADLSGQQPLSLELALERVQSVSELA
jgi:hypothetical protein